jgi:hypothetical protein
MDGRILKRWEGHGPTRFVWLKTGVTVCVCRGGAVVMTFVNVVDP